MRIRGSLGVLAALVACGAMVITTAGRAVGGSTSIALVVGGLNGPRGVAFDRQGSLYVAEAGQYFDIAPGPFGVSHTGKADKFKLTSGGASLVWSTGFDSVYDSAHGGPEVLGPAGISAFGNGCMSNSAGQRLGCQVLVFFWESSKVVSYTTPGLRF